MSLAPRGDGHTVIVLPGLGGSDRSTAVLRRYLSSMGFDARSWGLGRNLGPRMASLPERLAKMFEDAVAESDGRSISLVGWSLGGVYARLLAQYYPEQTRQVITLGSPFNGDPSSVTVYPIARRVLPLQEETITNLRLLAGQRLSVPNSNVFSRFDSIVPWQMATEMPDDRTENIEVYAGHLSLGLSPAVLYAIADRLAQAENAWQPFHRQGWRLGVYGPARLDVDTDLTPEVS